MCFSSNMLPIQSTMAKASYSSFPSERAGFGDCGITGRNPKSYKKKSRYGRFMLMMVTFDVYMTSSFTFDKSLCYIWLMWYLCPTCDVTAGVKGSSTKGLGRDHM